MRRIVPEARDSSRSELPHAEPALQLPDRGARMPVRTVERDGVGRPPPPAVDDPPVCGAQHLRRPAPWAGRRRLPAPLSFRPLPQLGPTTSPEETPHSLL